MKKYAKVVLAYSGGLDTSVIIPYLKETYGCEVIAFCADVGQKEDLEFVREKALKTGASKAYVEDLREEFVEDFIWPTLKAGAKYEGKYLLGTSFARPIIAKRLVEVMEKEGTNVVAHGCTGKGNDQVRFEYTVKAFAPDTVIIAPWREWSIKSRDEEIEYAKERGIPVPVTKESNYSRDMNLWHLSHEGQDLENPANEPNYESLLQIISPLSKTPDKSEYVEIAFEEGIPISVNGKKYGPVEIIEKLNDIGARHGVGIVDLVENRLVGMKSRGVYETPGGTLLYQAHELLESICLDRETTHYKAIVALKFADLVYFGQWYSPLRESISAFVDSTQKTVTGEARLKLFKGQAWSAGVRSPYSLYNEEYATFGKEAVYDQKDAKGFINLFALPATVRAKMIEKTKPKAKPGAKSSWSD